VANQRENFESAIMRSLYGQMGTPEELFRRDADGDCYTSSVIQSAWWGYQVGGAGTNRLEAADRQLVLLGLAYLALLRPVINHDLLLLSDRLEAGGSALFEQLKELNRYHLTGSIHSPAGRAQEGKLS
jgi:hypothetical protein